jgi:hypothetical protein
MWGFHEGQRERSREQEIASMCRRWAPRRMGIPGRRFGKGKVAEGAESWRPLGMRGEEVELSERMKFCENMMLAAASKTLWTMPRCGAPNTAGAIHVL